MPRTILVDFPDGDPITALEERMTATEARLAALENAPPAQPPVEPPTEPDFTHYMANTGSDANAGTIDAPWRSLHHAFRNLKPGDTLLIRGGSYDQLGVDVYLTPHHGKGPELRLSGTETAPITIRSYPGEWAVFDGLKHEGWPSRFNYRFHGDLNDAMGPRLHEFTGSHVHWEHLEFRNSIGAGPRAYAMHCKWRHCVFQNSHAQGLDIQGSHNEVAYNLFQDNYSCSNDGNSANGLLIRFGEGVLNRADRFPEATASDRNHVHHNVARNVSDDGFGGGTSTNGIWEYNVSFQNGYGKTGNGEGFKMGFGNKRNTGNVFRFNLSWDNRKGFSTNTSTGVSCHNNTSYSIRGGTGFVLTSHDTPGAGNNTAHNNLSIQPGDAHRAREARVTVHTHNAGFPKRWDVLGNEGNFDQVDLDPRVLSFDWKHPDFLRLATDSPYAAVGLDIAGGSTTLGAIPVGQEFAGGWDWRALVRRFPSHGLKARSVMYPIEQR